jgi:hypothetical protein
LNVYAGIVGMAYSVPPRKTRPVYSSDSGMAGARFVREAVRFRRGNSDLRASPSLKKSPLTVNSIVIKRRPT